MGVYTPGVHFAGVHASLAYGLRWPGAKGFDPLTPGGALLKVACNLGVDLRNEWAELIAEVLKESLRVC